METKIGYLQAIRKGTHEVIQLKCDIEDLEMLSQYKWHVTAKYSSVARDVRKGKKLTTELLYRLLTNAKFVVFRNGDKFDFRRKNLQDSDKGLRDRKFGVYLKGNPFTIVQGAGVTMWITTRDKKEIPFFIDEEDLELVCGYTWHLHSGGYIATHTKCVKGKSKREPILLHRLVMNAKSDDEIDHKNRVKTDCRKSNLRFCTQTQNLHNASMRSDNTSGITGVSQNKPNLWEACMEMYGKRLRKFFPTFAQAVAQRKQWEEIYNPSGLKEKRVS